MLLATPMRSDLRGQAHPVWANTAQGERPCALAYSFIEPLN